MEQLKKIETEKSKFQYLSNLYTKLEANFKEFNEVKDKVLDIIDTNFSWRNTRLDYWKYICSKYNETDILNCYGDIFFIDEKIEKRNGEVYYIGRRILWNLDLSKEQYIIEEEITYSGDEELSYAEYDYNISLKI